MNTLFIKKLFSNSSAKVKKDEEDIYTQIGNDIEQYVSPIIHENMDNRYELTHFFEIIKDITSNETVKQMKNFKQHCNTSCYKHCMQVAYFTYITCKKLKLDYVSATRAAMLHDLFLYDWRKKYRNIELSGLHAFIHPKIALKNASNIFELNEIEKDIIEKHMWPVTFSFPKYKESYIVTVMDKYSACLEIYSYIKEKFKKGRLYKHAYTFLNAVLLK